MFKQIRAVIFDLDGTLYKSDGLAEQIHLAACGFIARLKGIDTDAAMELLRETRSRLAETLGMEPSMTTVCAELGGSPQEFHRAITPGVTPEAFLHPDARVAAFLSDLGKSRKLYLYTNNNRELCDRIMQLLGLSGLFSRVFTIEDFWRPKPDRCALEAILAAIGRKPEECLFVGDRYDVDLRLPGDLGSAVMLVSDVDDLLRLKMLIEGVAPKPRSPS